MSYIQIHYILLFVNCLHYKCIAANYVKALMKNDVAPDSRNDVIVYCNSLRERSVVTSLL